MKSDRLRKAAKQKRRIAATRASFATVRKRQRLTAARIPDMQERKARLRATKERSIGNSELLEQAMGNLVGNGMQVTLARTSEEALALVKTAMGDRKLAVKSKSNVTKELDLARELGRDGIEIFETDIGDRVIQIAGEGPSHPTGPAAHLSSQDIARVLSQHFGRELPADPLTLTQAIRDEVAAKIDAAAIGITGANAIAATEGAILLVHNEGNVTQVMMRPEQHIIIAGVDKILPDLEEAVNLARVQTFYATGTVISSFINIVSGPSKTADIEKKLVKGVHGPKSVSLILLDNMRSEIAEGEFRELLYCIGCGECLVQCPAYFVYGNRFGYHHNLGGRGIVYSALADTAAADARKELYSCLTCGRCKKHCPVQIDTPALVRKLRQRYPTVIPERHLEEAYRFAGSHLRLLFSGVRLELLALLAAGLSVERE